MKTKVITVIFIVYLTLLLGCSSGIKLQNYRITIIKTGYMSSEITPNGIVVLVAARVAMDFDGWRACCCRADCRVI